LHGAVQSLRRLKFAASWRLLAATTSATAAAAAAAATVQLYARNRQRAAAQSAVQLYVGVEQCSTSAAAVAITQQLPVQQLQMQQVSE
jgi:hypothetical protein